MSGKAKIFIISGVTLFILLMGGWGYVYASSSNSPRQSPPPSGHVASDEPLISAALVAKPGVKVDSVVAQMDGSPISSGIKLERYGFRYAPGEKLAQGEHLIVATINYRVFLVPRTATLRWSFEVDTVAPQLEANDGHSIFATQNEHDVVTGHVDPGSKVTAEYGPVSPKVSQLIDGTFTVAVKGVEPKADLVVKAVDLAGNTTVARMSVVKDTAGPKLSGLSPASGDTIREGDYSVTSSVADGQSFVQSAEVFVDNKLVGSSLKKGVLATEGLNGLSEGKHTVKIIAVDGAGNRAVKKSDFVYDSRRIVVNRAERRLYLYRGGKLWRTWRVAVGEPRYPTPSGDWEIVAMRYRPTWVNPGSGWATDMPASIPPGPGNPLGTRAMNLDASGIRIHGTYQAHSIGTAASHGCIRMRLADVEALFDLVGIGVPVIIT